MLRTVTVRFSKKAIRTYDYYVPLSEENKNLAPGDKVITHFTNELEEWTRAGVIATIEAVSNEPSPKATKPYIISFTKAEMAQLTTDTNRLLSRLEEEKNERCPCCGNLRADIIEKLCEACGTVHD